MMTDDCALVCFSKITIEYEIIDLHCSDFDTKLECARNQLI